MFKNLPSIIIAICLVLPHNEGADAALIEFWNDAAGWQGAVSDYTFIDFTQFPVGTVITSQYEGFSVTTFAFIHNAQSYSDGFGLLGLDGIRLEFHTPAHAVGVDHLGAIQFALFREGELIATSSQFGYGAGVHFSGIISEVAFDEVYMFKPQPPFSNNVISLDNLYWAMPVPAPGVAAVMAIGLFAVSRRRRR